MAPPPPPPSAQQSDGESHYLPSLGKCLAQGQKILSWKLVYDTLASRSGHAPPQSIIRFLTDPVCAETRARPLEPFPKATPQSKADYEARTAAAQITPAQDGRYSLNEVKEDTLWLVSEAGIDEATALRLVVLEWQARTSRRARFGEAAGVGTGKEAQAPRRVRLLKLLIEERSAVLAVVLYIQSATKLPQVPISSGRTRKGRGQLVAGPSWLAEITGKAEIVPPNVQTSLSPSFRAVETRLQSLQDGCSWTVSAEAVDDLDFAFRHGLLLDIYRILQLVFVDVAQLSMVAATSVQAWFDLMERYFFFSSLSELPDEYTPLVRRIQSIVSLISPQILTLGQALDSLDNASTTAAKLHILDPECRKAVDSAVFGALEIGNPLASMAAFAWSVVSLSLLNHPAVIEALGSETFRSPGSGSLDKSPVGLIVDAVSRSQLGRDDALDAATKLAQGSLDALQAFSVVEQFAQNISSVFETLPGDVDVHVRILLLDLMRQGVLVANYGPEVISATIAVLNPTGNLIKQGHADAVIASIVAADEDIFVPAVIDRSQSRYPYEMQPFLRLWTSMSLHLGHDDDRYSGSLIMSPSLTFMLPVSYQDYEIGGSNHISLTRALPLVANEHLSVPKRSKTSTAMVLASDTSNSFWIPARTVGGILTDGKPIVAQFHYEHQVIEYLVAVLTTGTTSSSQRIAYGEPPSADILNEIINFLTANVISISTSASSQVERESGVENFLGSASETLDRNSDVVSLVQDIFEETLSRQVQQPDADSLRLLLGCVSFFTALFPALPGRVWPALIRSGLANTDSGNVSIAAIVSAAEMPSGRYDFFEASIKLFDAAVLDVVRNSMHRRSARPAVHHRFTERRAVTAMAMKGTNKALLSFTRTCTEFLQSSLEWYFTQEKQRKNILLSILGTFKTVLTSFFGHDNSPSKPEGGQSLVGLCAELEPSAEYIVNALTTKHTRNAFLESVRSFLLNELVNTGALFTEERQLSIQLSQSVLEFLSLLLRVARSRNSSSTGLVEDVRNIFPDLVKVYSAQPEVRTAIMDLLLDMMDASNNEAEDYQSLFGKLGEETANDFIAILIDFGSPLDDADLEDKIWKFLEDVVASRHRWFATLLLLGISPKEAMKTKDHSNNKSLVTNALDFLQGKEELTSKTSQSRLRFLTSTLNHWQWTTSLVQQRTDFLTKLSDFTTGSFTQSNGVKSIPSMVDAANKFRTLSLVVEFLAVYLHNLRESSQSGGDFVKQLMERITIGSLEHDGVAPPNYNTALHRSLQSLFDKKCPGWSPTAFKALLGTRGYGKSYFYDYSYAAQVLAFEPSWNKGMSDELARANCNLSVVQSQVDLAKSWRMLALELSAWAHDGIASHRQLAYIAHKCLYANKQHRADEPYHEQLTSSRTDLALVVLQQLVDAGSTVAPLATLRALILDALSEYAPRDDIPLEGAAAVQYRTLLRMLLLVLQVRPSTSGAKDLSAPSDLKDERASLQDVVSCVVAKGFRVLASQVYDNASAISPIDFALITSTLHGILALPSIESITTQIGISIVQSNVAQYAVALFSWSDRITLDGDDPIFAEISINFLLQLSHLQVVTDSFATEGLLSQLSSSNVVNCYRRKHGAGPFTRPLRYYAVWTRGILPLCLNMLTTVGESLAAEVIAFLNSFAPQLERASTALDPERPPTRLDKSAGSGTVSLSIVHEAHTLALIATILERYRNSPGGNGGALAQVGDLQWDRAGMREDVDGWLKGSKAALRERIAPTSSREEALLQRKPLSLAEGFESRLEEMVWRELEGVALCLDGDGGKT